MCMYIRKYTPYIHTKNKNKPQLPYSTSSTTERIIASSPTRAKTRPNRALHVTVDPVMVPAHRFVCPLFWTERMGRGMRSRMWDELASIH